MSIYDDILSWSQNRPLFIRDALRRIITSTTLSSADINELVLLVKKECGDKTVMLNPIPLTESHIPASVVPINSYPRLINISNPVNICALHDRGNLQFKNIGLTVVYGNNGSGKSSYSRILRKLCWSRNPSISLKKNVFTHSTNQQQVDFVVECNGTNTRFSWKENSPSNPILNSIFVFDNECGNIYINNENPTEYKPVGIDVLERLIGTLGAITQNLTDSVARFNTGKPSISPNLVQTETGKWYGQIEEFDRDFVESHIQFTQSDAERKQELLDLTSEQDPLRNITYFNGQKLRIQQYVRQFMQIEAYFNHKNIQEVREIRRSLETIDEAYQIATKDLQSINKLEGVGTSPWRVLWEAARDYAHDSHLTDGKNFPSMVSLEKCVLCQQDLDAAARKRLIAFNEFVLNSLSTQRDSIIRTIKEKQEKYNSLTIPSIENFTELELLLPNFRLNYGQFTESITRLKAGVIAFLQSGSELNVSLQCISTGIANLIPDIDVNVGQNQDLIKSRDALIAELNELTAKEFLFKNKAVILQYIDERKLKAWIGICQAQLSTNGISRKIGELVEDQAVSLQHSEFISHLSFFNRDLASKVLLSKTRTSQGNTYQRCSLNGVVDSISSILSEGEQKIIALSNFLAECTIDNRLNSIIFDDPVTSLDINYRDLIADKFVQLARDRQIIVFTHELAFLRLLIDTHKIVTSTDCTVIGIDKYNGISGIVTDEIPFLAKNIQERVNSIRRILADYDGLDLTDAHGRETKLDSARKRFRMLLERSVEEILSNKTYERFNKNIHLKKGNLSGYIVTEQTDVDFLLNLFSKYSVTEHDGGVSTIPSLPSKVEMVQHLRTYDDWNSAFKTKLKTFQATYF